MYIVYCKAHHTENVCKAKILLQLATLLEPPYAKNNSSYGCFFFFWFFVFPSSFFACRTPRWKTLKLPPDVALKSQRTFASFPCDLRIFATIICLNLFHWKRGKTEKAREKKTENNSESDDLHNPFTECSRRAWLCRFKITRIR